LLAEFEVTAKFRTPEEQLDSEVHLMGQLPGEDFSEVFGGGHGTERCNRVASSLSAKCGLIVIAEVVEIEESAMFHVD
jgi:hypothetical protein